jgi:hypothetical protein
MLVQPPQESGVVALADIDLELLREKIKSAYSADDAILSKFRGYARRLREKVRPLRSYSVNAVAFVSADGGDNRLVFNPAVVELVRVVDSRGNQCVLDAVPGTARLSDLQDRTQPNTQNTVTPLQRLCSDLQMGLSDLSYLIRGMGQEGKSTGAMRCYRDIVEWSVLYDLMTDPSRQWGADTILVRDGLLRTKSFTRDAFPRIDERLRAAADAHSKQHVNLSLVGVAKKNAVLGRLAVALELEATFHRAYPCYVPVDTDIEEDCYNFDRTWLETFETAEPNDEGRKQYQSLGRLYLVKFGDRPFDPVWPVDVAVWQAKDAERILGQLMVDAQQGFPIPDYPMCIQRAHDFAKLTGLEVEILQDILVHGLCEKLTPDEAERLLRLKHLGTSLVAARYKEA